MVAFYITTWQTWSRTITRKTETVYLKGPPAGLLPCLITEYKPFVKMKVGTTFLGDTTIYGSARAIWLLGSVKWFM